MATSASCSISIQAALVDLVGDLEGVEESVQGLHWREIPALYCRVIAEEDRDRFDDRLGLLDEAGLLEELGRGERPRS